MKIHILFLFIVFAFFSGCYTSFRHPLVEDNSGLGEVSAIRSSDNCMECHQDSQLAERPILPDAAKDDMNWYFYTQSAWWEGEENYDARYPAEGNSDIPLPTGYRHPVGGGSMDTPYNTIAPSVTVPSGLSKTAGNSTTGNAGKAKDSRRGFDRRKESQQQQGEKTRSSKRKKE